MSEFEIAWLKWVFSVGAVPFAVGAVIACAEYAQERSAKAKAVREREKEIERLRKVLVQRKGGYRE